ncbi:glycosyltransferase [Lapidilactobacillus mulanensis]|uniref:Glycosyltransferase n=2 Tax=Lapidilactobacillus mulanensis TaxID=2485999 RepID=A0ABW4DNB6_9LACO|nr:glycosyltransferase [Lapidilactobacillus mulanensis]
MATYNGQATIERQLRSILPQLSNTDEVLIVDDQSSDDTIQIINDVFQESDIPHQIFINQVNQGPIASFERAITKAKGDYIYLSDQDDQWFSNKISVCQATFKLNKSDLVVHDAIVVDKNLQVIDNSWNHYNHNNVDQGVLGNLIKNGYTGAMMAFTNKVKQAILPFPRTIAMHDQWIFLVTKKNRYRIDSIKEPLMNYVRHGNNVTGQKRKKLPMILDRLTMIQCYWSIKRK